MAATKSPLKITDLYNGLSNPSGGSAALQPFIDLFKGLAVKGPILNSPALNSLAPKSSVATPSPNMSTVKGPVYVPPPTPAPVAPKTSLSAFAAGAPLRAPAPVAPTPIPPVTPVAPVPPVNGSTGATGAAAPVVVPPHWLNADGSFKTPDQVASDVASTLKDASQVGDVGRISADQFAGKDKSADQLKTDARRINNIRNDIAVGESDPYKVASESGIAYTPAELSAIEKAYAGIYDPALDTAMNKLEQKQADDAAAATAAAKAEADRNAPFTLGKDQIRYDGKGNPIAYGGSSDAGDVTYVKGQNPTVDAYVKGFNEGTYKASDIPDAYKALVAQGVAQTKPVLSKSSNDAISVINELSADPNLEKITGLSIQHPSSFFPGTAVQSTQNLAKQLKGILSLENRTQLKGSGAISDFEFRVLGDAASALGIDENGRTNLSPDEFQNQLNKLKLKLEVGQTNLTDDELLYLQSKGYSPDEIKAAGDEQSFNDVGNTTASTGNRPQRNNNPGNIKAGGLADPLAIGKDDQGHLIFPDEDTGLKALTLDLTAKINGSSKYLPANPTIAQLGKVYAEDPNWPVKVAAILKVPVDTHTQIIPIKDLVKAVATQEGFYA